ncbi:MAG: hypothetical protein AABY65_12875, partial [Nitrospirota bacterium]
FMTWNNSAGISVVRANSGGRPRRDRRGEHACCNLAAGNKAAKAAQKPKRSEPQPCVGRRPARILFVLSWRFLFRFLRR